MKRAHWMAVARGLLALTGLGGLALALLPPERLMALLPAGFLARAADLTPMRGLLVADGLLSLGIAAFLPRLMPPLERGLARLFGEWPGWWRALPRWERGAIGILSGLALLRMGGVFWVPPLENEAANWYNYTRHSLAACVLHYPSPNNHLLYSLLSYLPVQGWPGPDPMPPQRLVAGLFGVLAIPLGWRLGRGLGGPMMAAGMAAGLLLLPGLVFASWQGRGHLPAAVLGLGMLGLLLRHRGQPRPGDLPALSLLAIGWGWLVPSLPMALPPLWLAGMASTRGRWRALRPWLWSGVLIGAVLIAVYAQAFVTTTLVLGQEFRVPSHEATTIASLNDWARVAGQQLATLSRYLAGGPEAVPQAALAGLVLLGLGGLLRSGREGHSFLGATSLALFAWPLLLGAILGTLPPARVLVFWYPVLLLLVVVGLRSLVQLVPLRWQRVGWAVGLLSLSGLWLTQLPAQVMERTAIARDLAAAHRVAREQAEAPLAVSRAAYYESLALAAQAGHSKAIRPPQALPASGGLLIQPVQASPPRQADRVWQGRFFVLWCIPPRANAGETLSERP